MRGHPMHRTSLWATQTTRPAPKRAPGYVIEAASEAVMAKTPPARQNLPLDRQKHVARRRVRRNTHRERSPEASSMHGRGPDGTHFCLSGYARSRERRTSLIRATCFRDQGRVSPSDTMPNRRSAFSRQGAIAKACGPSDQSAHPSSPNAARRPKVCLLPLRRGRNSSPPQRASSPLTYSFVV